MKPRVCVLRTDGTNCDRELAYSFNLVGGDAEIVHINSFLREDPIKRRRISLEEYHILAIPGGFSHGDYISAGKVFAKSLEDELGEQVQGFIDDGKLIIGICNGFQVLVKSGFLPMTSGKKEEQTTTLTYNSHSRFECRWVNLVSPPNKCVWTRGVDYIPLPVAHGEGMFVASEETIKELFEQGLVVYQYADKNGKPTMSFPENPNGSLDAIAGICDPTGRIFGLMPHPERYNHENNHPLSRLQSILQRDYIDESDPAVAERLKSVGELPVKGLGLAIFKNGVEYIR